MAGTHPGSDPVRQPHRQRSVSGAGEPAIGPQPSPASARPPAEAPRPETISGRRRRRNWVIGDQFLPSFHSVVVGSLAMALLALPCARSQGADEELWRDQAGTVINAAVVCKSDSFAVQDARACFYRFLDRAPRDVRLLNVVMFFSREDARVYNWRLPVAPVTAAEWLRAAQEMPRYQGAIAQGLASGKNALLRYLPRSGPPVSQVLRGSDPSVVSAGGIRAEILDVGISGPVPIDKGAKLVSLTVRMSTPLSERSGRSLLQHLRKALRVPSIALTIRADRYFWGMGSTPLLYPFDPGPLPTGAEIESNPTLLCAHDSHGRRCFSLPPGAVR